MGGKWPLVEMHVCREPPDLVHDSILRVDAVPRAHRTVSRGLKEGENEAFRISLDWKAEIISLHRVT